MFVGKDSVGVREEKREERRQGTEKERKRGGRVCRRGEGE